MLNTEEARNGRCGIFKQDVFIKRLSDLIFMFTKGN